MSETSSAGSLRLSEARACPPGTGQAGGLGCVLILGHPAGSAHLLAARVPVRSRGEKAAGLPCPAPAACLEGGVGGIALWSLQISEKLFPALPSPRWMQHRWICVLAGIPLGARDTFHVHLRSGGPGVLSPEGPNVARRRSSSLQRWRFIWETKGLLRSLPLPALTCTVCLPAAERLNYSLRNVVPVNLGRGRPCLCPLRASHSCPGSALGTGTGPGPRGPSRSTSPSPLLL